MFTKDKNLHDRPDLLQNKTSRVNKTFCLNKTSCRPPCLFIRDRTRDVTVPNHQFVLVRSGMSGLAPNWIKLAPNGTKNLGLFKISFSTFWVGHTSRHQVGHTWHRGKSEMKIHCKLILKAHKFIPFDNILAHIVLDLTSLLYCTANWRLVQQWRIFVFCHNNCV